MSDDNKPDVRQQRLALAAGIYAEGIERDTHSGYIEFGFSGNPDTAQAKENEYVAAIENAEEVLAQFRRGRALRIALDVLLPGWFDIDLSVVEGRALDDAAKPFVSNSPEEWFTWLTTHGISTKDAVTLITEDAGQRAPRNVPS